MCTVINTRCAKGDCVAAGNVRVRKKYGGWGAKKKALEVKATKDVALGSSVWKGCPLSKGYWVLPLTPQAWL